VTTVEAYFSEKNLIISLFNTRKTMDIIITPSILEKFGFEQTEKYGNTYSYSLKVNKSFEIVFQFVDDRCHTTWINEQCLGNKIDKLNKLQHLCFTLTGKELKEKESAVSPQLRTSIFA
jgi:hypothetical protein